MERIRQQNPMLLAGRVPPDKLGQDVLRSAWGLKTWDGCGGTPIEKF
jgi:hypothetical protein